MARLPQGHGRRREGPWNHQDPVTSPGCGTCRKVGRSPGKLSKLRQGELKRAGFGEGRCLAREVGRGGDAEGSGGWGQGTPVGRFRLWEGLWQHGDVGRDDSRAEGGWLVWAAVVFYEFRRRCKIERGGKGVADSSTLGPPCPHLALPKWVEGTGPTAAVWAGPWPGHRGQPGAESCSLPCNPQFLGGWAETCSWVYKYSAPAKPINVALGL